MRATKYKHYGKEKEIINKNKTANAAKKSSKLVKTFSFGFAFILAAICLIVPTTTLAPSADAFEDSRAAAYSVGGIEAFASQIADNCAEETTAPATHRIETTAEETSAEETSLSETEETKEDLTEAEKTEAEEETVAGEEEAYESISYEVSEITSQPGYLISISNPDPKYSPQAVILSAYDREKLERLVMGEAGSLGYTGCALVAQTIRDAMNRSGTTSIDAIISEYQYYGSTSVTPSSDAKKAVAYIFDENGSAVQHRILCFYTGTSNWHETQEFVTSFGNVRFFDYITD